MTTTTLRTQLNAERSEATRARLLRHARAVFEKRGYGAASVADIVNASGLARGTFYVHFKSKREIFIAVVHSVRADLLEGQMRPMEGTGTVRDTVRFAIEQYLKAFKASARMINLIEEISISDRVVRAAWMETRDALQANTVHALTRLRERGLADFEGDPRIMSMVVGGMVERMGSIRYVLGLPRSTTRSTSRRSPAATSTAPASTATCRSRRPASPASSSAPARAARASARKRS